MHLLNSDTATPAATQTTAPRLIRRTEVQKMTGLGASSIYQLVRDGDFPKPVQLSERRVAWIESEVAQWVSDRIAGRSKLEASA